MDKLHPLYLHLCTECGLIIPYGTTKTKLKENCSNCNKTGYIQYLIKEVPLVAAVGIASEAVLKAISNEINTEISFDDILSTSNRTFTSANWSCFKDIKIVQALLCSDNDIEWWEEHRDAK